MMKNKFAYQIHNTDDKTRLQAKTYIHIHKYKYMLMKKSTEMEGLLHTDANAKHKNQSRNFSRHAQTKLKGLI